MKRVEGDWEAIGRRLGGDWEGQAIAGGKPTYRPRRPTACSPRLRVRRWDHLWGRAWTVVEGQRKAVEGGGRSVEGQWKVYGRPLKVSGNGSGRRWKAVEGEGRRGKAREGEGRRGNVRARVAGPTLVQCDAAVLDVEELWKRRDRE